MSDFNQENFEKLTTLVERSAANGTVTLNMGSYETECGTAACLLGLAALSDEFPQLVSGGPYKPLYLAAEKTSSVYNIGHTLFGLSRDETYALFHGFAGKRAIFAKKLGWPALDHFTRPDTNFTEALRALYFVQALKAKEQGE